MSQSDDLEQSVRARLDRYFSDLGDQAPSDVWDMVMRYVERAVLETIMERTADNQSRAADILGITRNTLRKKLRDHGLRSD